MVATKKQAPKTAKQVAAERRVKKAADAMAESQGRAEDLEVTSDEEWLVEAEGIKLQLPSGKVCLARNPGMHVFIEKGLIPNSLMPIVMKAADEGKGVPPAKLKEMESNPQAIRESMELMNAVLCEVLIKPSVKMPPESNDQRLPGVIYADIVDMNDKGFIFQWVVGGTRDLERFRSQQAAMLVSLSDGEAVGEEA